MPDLLYGKEGLVATITLNRPERRNAFSTEMLDLWVDAIEAAGADPGVKVVVLTGAGSAFCAGGDLGEILTWGDADPLARKDFLGKQIHRIPRAMAGLEKPAIAAMNGAAMGAGLDMALMCDIRLAAESAKMGETYLLGGLVPGDGGAFLLPRIVGLARTCELLFTGEVLTAAQAERIGLVNRVVPDAELLGAAHALAERIAARSAAALRLTKRLIYQGLDSTLETALEMASSYMAHVLPLPETREALQGLLNRTRSRP